jgi:hypothetical protein
MFGYPLNPVTLIWVISALATAGVIIRPFSWPEAIWAVPPERVSPAPCFGDASTSPGNVDHSFGGQATKSQCYQ